MSSPPSIPNTLLPFDVLGYIFHYYAGKETIRHPLETLLLVCHAWSDAVLGHRHLWSNITIYIGHKPTSSIWKKRLPLRLARAGPVVPLFISLFNTLDIKDRENVPECIKNDPIYSNHRCTDFLALSWPKFLAQCPCYNDATEFAKFALECLAGNKGELCARWKEFHVDLGPKYGACRNIARALSYPTPLLTSLRVENLALDLVGNEKSIPIIEPPRLEEVIFKRYFPLEGPDFRTLLELEIHGTKTVDLGACSDFRSASRLQVLCLRHTRRDGVLLPEQLRNLRSIKIIGEEFPSSLHDCRIPDLSMITLEFTDNDPFVQMLLWRRIDLGKLQKLSVIWATTGMDTNRWTVETCEDMMSAFCCILNKAPNLSYVAGNQHIINIFLKILWDSWSVDGAAGILGSKQFSLRFILDVGPKNTRGELETTLARNDCPETLVTLAERWGLLSPDLPINKFLKLLLRDAGQVPISAIILKRYLLTLG